MPSSQAQPLLLEAPTPVKLHRGSAEWTRIRLQYESTDISQRELAKREGVPESTLTQRAMREKWRKPGARVAEFAGDLEAAANEQARKMVADQLQPFIDRHKIAITKRAVNMSMKGLKRLGLLWDSSKPSSTRFEADGARALETFIRVGRTSLGMDDNTNGGKGLTVDMLSGSGSQIRIRQD